MARRSTAKIFGTNVEDGLMKCEPENVEYSIDSTRKSLRMKMFLGSSKRKSGSLFGCFNPWYHQSQDSPPLGTLTASSGPLGYSLTSSPALTTRPTLSRRSPRGRNHTRTRLYMT